MNKQLSVACRYMVAACLASMTSLAQSAAVNTTEQAQADSSVRILSQTATTNFLPNGKMVITNTIVRVRPAPAAVAPAPYAPLDEIVRAMAPVVEDSATVTQTPAVHHGRCQRWRLCRQR